MTLLLTAMFLAAGPDRNAAERALDAQDRTALERLSSEAAQRATAYPEDADAQYRSAWTHSMLAQLAIELGDKGLGRRAAESGIEHARRAVKTKPENAEYHRILGTLCGQIIPANVMAGLRYGKCAMEEVGKAVEMAPKSAMVWVSRGVGNYYLPPAFGGGVNLAIQDFQKAIQIDPKSSEAHLWLGIALRKSGKNAEARKSLARSLELNPNRKWAKQQLEKTPAQ